LVRSAPVFDGLVAELDPRSPNPALPNTFVNGLANILDNDYDDGDFVVLVGHSLGGNSVLRVANQTHRKIDLLVTFDPVGWSTTGINETKFVEIIPRLTVDKPDFLGGGEYTVYPGLFIPVPVCVLAAIFSTDMIDPVRGLPGYRNELESPGHNVRYFFNRWQTNFPFPFDYDTSGRLDDSDVRNSVGVFSYAGHAIAAQ